MKNTNRFANPKDALKASLQAGAAHDYAVVKSGRRYKKEASTKKAYEPGTIGSSQVVQDIKEVWHGLVPSRCERRMLSKMHDVPFQRFYSGV
jgi:hypothetical protein